MFTQKHYVVSTEKALNDSVDHFSEEFEMAGSLVELSEKQIAKEWGVSLDVAKGMKTEAMEIHRDFVIAINLAKRELSKVIEVNKKYWI